MIDLDKLTKEQLINMINLLQQENARLKKNWKEGKPFPDVRGNFSPEYQL